MKLNSPAGKKDRCDCSDKTEILRKYKKDYEIELILLFETSP